MTKGLATRHKLRFHTPMNLGKIARRVCWRQICIFVASIVLTAESRPNQTTDTNDIAVLMRPPKVELHNVQAIKLALLPPIGKEEQARILMLIGNLANITNPDFGLSPTMSGDAFAPVSNARRAGAMLLTDHRLSTSEDFVELVKLGPKALPLLLKSLDNQTPTKLVITHDSFFGGMWFANELRGNPGNEAEQKVLTTVTNRQPGFDMTNISPYTVRIGDVCLVIVGQIVGRSYQAVRYQPTACIAINSPTHDTNLAQQVRKIWSSPEPAQHLLDSLLLDFASIGVFNGKSLDGWDVGSELQIGAAMRLLYYFPRETTNLIATRLRGLDVRKYDMAREVADGVRPNEFIKAVSWSQEPAIQAELHRICDVTTDPEILRFAGMAMEGLNANDFRMRLEETIANLPETEPGPYGDGYNLLVSLGKQFGMGARPVFEHYMQNASLQRRRSMCKVLAEVRGDWSVDLLGPLLEDSRLADGWDYSVIPGQNEPRLPIRICDEAAETITQNFPKLKFKMAGQHSDLNRQIQKMQEQIAHHNY
jgi:hypothetical protein